MLAENKAARVYCCQFRMHAVMSVQELGFEQDVQDCIDNCFRAAEAAEACASHCIRQADEDLVRCIELCRDAANTTTTSALLMSRESENMGRMCGVCAEVCRMCAEECGRHDGEPMRVCAEVMRECADSCSRMAS